MITLEAVIDRGLVSRFHILEIDRISQPRQASDESKMTTIGRWSRPDGTSRTADKGLDLSGLAVESLDSEERACGVLAVLPDPSRRDVLTEEHIAAIAGERGLCHQLLVTVGVRSLGQLESATAADVKQPDLASADAAGRHETLLGDQEVAVRAPSRVGDNVLGFLGDLDRIRSVAA